MPRNTIDFGIDLGTTNSTIAVINETSAKVIPNKAGSGITPSAVWIDRRGSLHVGAESKQRALIDDADNAALEFKLCMGLGEEGKKRFVRSGRDMLPEEMSAEVLKSLKADAHTNLGEVVRTAVITVPAAFELPQTNATQKAAQLAGFALSPLLMEPVAASLAYGFQTQSDNVYWLVYDFGGGTFDAAVMRVRDGLIQVVNHDGDNHLGGKLLDWDIVTKKLIPAAAGQGNLPDFRRGNPRWAVAHGKMKYYAEQAKIEVCRTRNSYEIWIESLCVDADGKTIDFAYTLTPRDVEDVSRPYIERSLGLCRKTLKDKGLAGSNMERILMVGGTTLNPWVRDAVQAELGSRLEFGIDPVTVVAQGAAIFASTQALAVDDAPLPVGTWRVQIEHEPVGNVTDPDIGGRVMPPDGRSLKGYTIEFVDAKTKWRSGRLTLGAEGVFLTRLSAEGSRRCEFDVELSDPTGTRILTSPPRIVYTLGVVPDKSPVPNTIGVGLANDSMRTYLEKGTKLSARKQGDQYTTVPLRAGKAEDEVRIPILEGENSRATRNHCIGELVIKGTDIRRDLPTHSPVEITILMDEKLAVHVHVYIATIDEEFDAHFDQKMHHDGVDELRKQAKAQNARLAGAREKADRAGTPKGRAALARIQEEQLIQQVDALLEVAAQDREARSQLDRRLRDLSAAVDDVEDAIEWPVLMEKAEDSRQDAENIVNQHGDAADKNALSVLEGDLRRAVAAADPDLLRRCTNDLDSLWFRVISRLKAFHIQRFELWVSKMPTMTDQAQAAQIVAQGRRALNSDDIEALKAANRQLISLLPKDQQQDADRRRGTVM